MTAVGAAWVAVGSGCGGWAPGGGTVATLFRKALQYATAVGNQVVYEIRCQHVSLPMVGRNT